MKTTQLPAGQQKAYLDNVKHKALQPEENGPSLQDVSLELDASTIDLLRWQRNAGQNPHPAKVRFDAEFKARAVHKLAKGQSLRQVASAMGVSIRSLVQWQKQVAGQQAVFPFSGHKVTSGTTHPDRFHGVTHPVIDNGQPLGLVTATSGVVGTAIHRRKSQADAQESLTTTLDNTVLSYTNEDKEKAMGLLHLGKPITQVSVSLGIPPVLVRRWWLHQNVSGDSDKVDGRRLYNDAFKAEALRQIHQGVSIRQLAKSLGVTEMTLHKWRKQASFLPESMGAELQQPEFVASEQAASDNKQAEEPVTERISRLEQQLQKVEQERDTLKKAIQILMRAS